MWNTEGDNHAKPIMSRGLVLRWKMQLHKLSRQEEEEHDGALRETIKGVFSLKKTKLNRENDIICSRG